MVLEKKEKVRVNENRRLLSKKEVKAPQSFNDKQNEK